MTITAISSPLLSQHVQQDQSLELQQLKLEIQQKELQANALKNKIQQQIKDRSPVFILRNKDGSLSEHFVQLLKLDKLYDPNDSFEKAVLKTQGKIAGFENKKWLQTVAGQKAGQTQPNPDGKTSERYQFQDKEEYKAIAEEVSKVANSVGLFDARKPLFKHYNYGICLGATLGAMRDRLNELATLWQEGLRFDELVILTGERDDLKQDNGGVDGYDLLCDEKKSKLAFKKTWQKPASIDEYKKRCKTEYDLAKELIDQLEFPEGMQAALQGKIVVVNAPKGEKPRPTTKDTYDVWIRTYQPQGTACAMSSPVVWAGQAIVADNCTRHVDLAIDTLAPQVSQELLDAYKERKVTLIFDTLSKLGYEILASDKK